MHQHACLSARNQKCTNWRCTFRCSVYSRVLVLLSFAQMTLVRCSVSVEFTRRTVGADVFPWSSCERELLSWEGGRKREKRQRRKQACDSLSYPLDAGLCDLNHSRERPLSPLHVQTGCHFYFAELLFSHTDAELWNTKFLTLTRKGFVSLPDVDKIWHIFIAVMLFWLKLYLHLVLFYKWRRPIVWLKWQGLK